MRKRHPATNRGRSLACCALITVGAQLALAMGSPAHAQVVEGQVVDENGAPVYRVDPFWPKTLPNNWSMQQVTGIGVDGNDHVWFLNRQNAPDPLEIIAEGDPRAVLCCVLGPELIELDPDGTVVHAWGGPGYQPSWPTGLQTAWGRCWRAESCRLTRSDGSKGVRTRSILGTAPSAGSP